MESKKEWVKGHWEILPEDRDAKTGYGKQWTLLEGEDSTSDFCVDTGPIGRKSSNPHGNVIQAHGIEEGWLEVAEDKLTLILTAPRLAQEHAEMRKVLQGLAAWDGVTVSIEAARELSLQARTLLAKLKGE